MGVKDDDEDSVFQRLQRLHDIRPQEMMLQAADSLEELLEDAELVQQHLRTLLLRVGTASERPCVRIAYSSDILQPKSPTGSESRIPRFAMYGASTSSSSSD